MTYVVDFEQSADYQGYRYILTRIAGKVSLRRQKIANGILIGDPEQIAKVDSLPDNLTLKGKYYTLLNGNMPAVA